MLEILSHEIEEPILMAIRSSQAISLQIDESTDVSVSRQLDLHVRYMDKKGKAFNQFLDRVTVPDGKADTMCIPTERLYGLGTDGAAVMTGRVNGVAKQLTDSFPKLVTVAYSSNNVKYMATFRDHLQDLYLYFRNSANRTATLKAASITLCFSDLKLKAIETLQRNLSAVLGALAELCKCPGAKGLYTFCATYRFVYVLPCTSRPMFCPTSPAFLKNIKEAGQTPLPGPFLSRLHQDLDDPQGLGAYNIQHEEERDRRGREVQDESREGQWARFQREVIPPYITGLETNLEKRFHNLDILGAFHVLGPQSATLTDDTMNISHLQTLSWKFCPQHEKEFIQGWLSFKNHVLTGIFKVKTDLRNQLQGENLPACQRISINGPCPEAFPYDRALESFF
ncbi:unnamed protein product [Leuciscus chuanchicus]